MQIKSAPDQIGSHGYLVVKFQRSLADLLIYQRMTEASKIVIDTIVKHKANPNNVILSAFTQLLKGNLITFAASKGIIRMGIKIPLNHSGTMHNPILNFRIFKSLGSPSTMGTLRGCDPTPIGDAVAHPAQDTGSGGPTLSVARISVEQSSAGFTPLKFIWASTPENLKALLGD